MHGDSRVIDKKVPLARVAIRRRCFYFKTRGSDCPLCKYNKLQATAHIQIFLACTSVQDLCQAMAKSQVTYCQIGRDLVKDVHRSSQVPPYNVRAYRERACEAKSPTSTTSSAGGGRSSGRRGNQNTEHTCRGLCSVRCILWCGTSCSHLLLCRLQQQMKREGAQGVDSALVAGMVAQHTSALRNKRLVLAYLCVFSWWFATLRC